MVNQDVLHKDLDLKNCLKIQILSVMLKGYLNKFCLWKRYVTDCFATFKHKYLSSANIVASTCQVDSEGIFVNE